MLLLKPTPVLDRDTRGSVSAQKTGCIDCCKTCIYTNSIYCRTDILGLEEIQKIADVPSQA